MASRKNNLCICCESALEHLRVQLNVALRCETKPMPFSEQIRFSKEHPGAHFVVGDFEIKCLKPEKYHL